MARLVKIHLDGFREVRMIQSSRLAVVGYNLSLMMALALFLSHALARHSFVWARDRLAPSRSVPGDSPGKVPGKRHRLPGHGIVSWVG